MKIASAQEEDPQDLELSDPPLRLSVDGKSIFLESSITLDSLVSCDGVIFSPDSKLEITKSEDRCALVDSQTVDTRVAFRIGGMDISKAKFLYINSLTVEFDDTLYVVESEIFPIPESGSIVRVPDRNLLRITSSTSFGNTDLNPPILTIDGEEINDFTVIAVVDSNRSVFVRLRDGSGGTYRASIRDSNDTLFVAEGKLKPRDRLKLDLDLGSFGPLLRQERPDLGDWESVLDVEGELRFFRGFLWKPEVSFSADLNSKQPTASKVALGLKVERALSYESGVYFTGAANVGGQGETENKFVTTQAGVTWHARRTQWRKGEISFRGGTEAGGNVSFSDDITVTQNADEYDDDYAFARAYVGLTLWHDFLNADKSYPRLTLNIPVDLRVGFGNEVLIVDDSDTDELEIAYDRPVFVYVEPSLAYHPSKWIAVKASYEGGSEPHYFPRQNLATISVEFSFGE